MALKLIPELFLRVIRRHTNYSKQTTNQQNEQLNQVKSNKVVETSISRVFNGYRVVKDLRDLLVKYWKEQCECLDGSTMIPYKPGVPS